MTRKNILIIAVAAVAIILGIILTRGEKDPAEDKKSAKSKEYAGLLDFLTAPDNEPESKEVNPDEVPSYEIEEAKIIKDVIVEKDPVCSGEDFKVTVVAHNPNGPDKHLVYRIGDKMGNPAILRFTQPGTREFYVVARDEGKHIDHRVVQVQVQDCPGKPVVVLKARMHHTIPETGMFEVTSEKGLTGTCTYEWDFGDGKKTTTNTGYATHTYADRVQSELQSSYVISLKVTDSLNKAVDIRASLSFPNIHYISKLMGQPILPVTADKFATYAGGIYEVNATIKNIFESQVEFDEAELEIKPCDSSYSPTVRVVQARELMDTSLLAPLESLTQTIRMSKALLPPSSCNVTITFSGPFDKSTRVTAKVYVDIPPSSAKDIDTARDKTVTDKAMVEKLNKASRILGTGKPITPEDLDRLEKEGKL
ncbi:MAG: hypothetical protein EPN93_12330 [Spirochaetes bacterium]|nr:MAG: hypothetical protein EPN93_12330 [Spirochaetota bacterium]